MTKKRDKQLVVSNLLMTIQQGLPDKVKMALSELSSIGNLSIIPDLLEILIKEENHINKNLITEFIANVQDPGIVQINMDFMNSFENLDKLKSVTPCIWNSKHDYSQYIADFVSLSVEGDYLLALECLTVIEQMTGPFNESWLLESQLYLKEYIEKSNNRGERKDIIISDIAYFIKEQNNSVDADLMLE